MKGSEGISGWVVMSTDYETEGVRALEMTLEQLDRMTEDPYRWKWAILALHNSVQAFMVHALSGSHLLGALDRKSAKRWQEAYEKGGDLPRGERLASFLTLFKWIQDASKMSGFVNSGPFIANKNHRHSLKILAGRRDDLVHYKPGSMEFVLGGMPEVFLNCIEVIEFLARDSGRVYWTSGDWATRSENALRAIRTVLETLVPTLPEVGAQESSNQP